MKKNTIQEKMFQELKEKKVFEKAQNYAFEYLENVFERNVSNPFLQRLILQLAKPTMIGQIYRGEELQFECMKI